MTEDEKTRYDKAIAEYILAVDKIDHWTEVKLAAASTLLELGEGGKHASPHGTATVSAPVRRFNADLAAKVLPPALLMQCSETVVIAAKAKSILPPALYAECSAPAKSAKPVLRVKPAEAAA